MGRLRVPTLTVENIGIVYSGHFLSRVPSCLQWCVLEVSNCRLNSTVVFTIEKNLHLSRPLKFKPMFFRGQLYSSKFLWCLRFPISAQTDVRKSVGFIFPLDVEFKKW